MALELLNLMKTNYSSLIERMVLMPMWLLLSVKIEMAIYGSEQMEKVL